MQDMIKRKVIIHIFSDDLLFAENYIKSLEKYTSNDFYHLYFFTCKGGNLTSNILKNNRIFILNKKSKSIHDYINLIRAFWVGEKIFFHGISTENIFNPILLLIPFLKNQTYWVIWGYDLHFQNKEKESHFLYKAFYTLWSFYIQNISNIVALIKDDYEHAKQKYHTKAVYHYAFYPNVVDFKMLDKRSSSCDDSSLHTILLGHAASPTNNHLEVLDWFKTFHTKKPFKVFCPLSYGSREYAEKVCEHGKAVLGDKFIPLLELMSPEDYADFLNTVDVAIMNHKRQEGLGNIIALLYLGKKVYVRSDTVTHSFLCRMGVDVFDTINLLINNQEDIFYFVSNTGISNNQIISREFSHNRSIDLWKKIFSID